MAGRLPFDGPGARNIVQGRESKPSLALLTPLETGEFTPSQRTPNSTSTSPLSTSHRHATSDQRFEFDPKARHDHADGPTQHGTQSCHEPYSSISSSSSSSRPVSAPSPSTRSTSISNNRTSTSPVGIKAGETAGAGKMNVLSACAPCKKAHLACDSSRPCKRCVTNRKSHLCQDVPHKKRGRPKISKEPVSEPYTRPRPLDSVSAALDTGGPGRWRGPHVNTPFTASIDASKSPLGPLPATMPAAPTAEPAAKSDLFEMFATTDLRIIRVTSNSLPLTGFHPHEFVNINLSDYIHPSDRYLLELDRKSLLDLLAPISRGPVVSDRETQASIIQIPDHILLRPLHGMPLEYPNKNVRLLRSDQTFDWFNVRMHLGSGLGASLLHPETLGKNYLCISLLLLHPPPSGGTVDRRLSMTDSYSPATPLTPATPTAMPQHLAGGLPSFSTIAAGIDGPRQGYGSRASPTQSNFAFVPPASRSLPSIPLMSQNFGPKQAPGPRYPDYSRQSPLPHRPSVDHLYWSGSGQEYGSHRDRRESYDGAREAHDWRRRLQQQDGLPPITDRTVTATASSHPPVEDRRDSASRHAHRGSATGGQDTRRTWEL